MASTRDVRLNVAAHLPEVTFTQQDIRADDGRAAARALEGYLQSHNALVVGPGLGRGPAITAFVRRAAEATCARSRTWFSTPTGLFALSELPDWPELLGPNAMLTPHSGELERLVGQRRSTAEPVWAQAGRLGRAVGLRPVAKGPFTMRRRADGRVDVWPRANAALATGGTGDVLAGICGGLLAQGLEPWDAARLAVGVHGLAAERVVTQRLANAAGQRPARRTSRGPGRAQSASMTSIFQSPLPFVLPTVGVVAPQAEDHLALLRPGP